MGNRRLQLALAFGIMPIVVFAFGWWDINPHHWSAQARMFCGVLSAAIFSLTYHMTDERG